jgi:hypothetical protein
MMTKFDKIAKENPFRVPEGYFEEVTGKIISQTSGKSKQSNRFRIRPILLAAASVTLFILLGYTASRLLIPHRGLKTESSVLKEDYLVPYLDELDLYTLEENASLAVPEEKIEPEKSEIIDYLILNNIQINEIYEFL